MLQVESFVLGEGEEGDMNNQFLLSGNSSDLGVGHRSSPSRQSAHFDPDTQARLVALLEAAGKRVSMRQCVVLAGRVVVS